ncbi:MAG: V-type ATP synthase subunit E [candidate division WOR-3 bacterium]
MGKKELIEKILSDARLRAAAIRAEAINEVRQIEQREREAEERLQAENEMLIRYRVNMILENARSQAQLEVKKMILSARWGVIERIKERTKYAVMNSPEYPELLKRLVEKYAGPKAKVHLSPEDTDRYGKHLRVELGEPVPISGGMLIRREREEIDLSLDSILTQVLEENITALAEVLFP